MGVSGDLVVAHLVPHGKDYLLARRDLAINEPVEFPLRPPLSEEARAQDDHPEPAFSKPLVNHLPEAVADLDRVLVEPDG